MANLLRQDILAKTPIPQDESPLYAKLPGEVRDSIFSYVLTDHPDPTPNKKFKENSCYTRPSYLAAQSTDTRLLRTCRAIYRETWFKPFLLREHTEWATGEDRAPPPHKAPPRLRPMLAKISKSLGTDSVEIERLRVFAQMYRLQENGLREVLRTPHLAPRTITLTIRHTDWWYWEEDEPLHFDGNWIEGVCQVLTPSTTQFCIELESLERKKDQVDKIAKQMVDSWFFKRPDGVILYADTSDSNRKVSRWSGSSTWHGQRWIRDETEPHKLDYYIVSITFRPLISIERSGGSVSDKAIKETQDPQAPDRPKLSLPDNQERIETESPCEWVSDSDDDDGYSGLPQPESDNDEWYAEMEEIYGNGRFMKGLFDDASAYPPYAILSHCWYSSELELTFKDFEDLSQHTSKPGYSKIISACRAAITQGYDWLWADNVCINEEDAVEKGETMKKIYSMFLEAGVCLLYLSEIPNANIKDDGKEILSSDIRKSRWVSRAWTYKELIPPYKSVFYAADWSQLEPEFQAAINTDMFGINPYDVTKEDRETSHFSSDGPTGAESLSSITSYSSAQSIDEEERPTITSTGRNLIINQNRASYKSTSRHPYHAKHSERRPDNYGDDVRGDPSDPQAKSQSGINILILDNDHAVGNTLARLLKRLIPAQVTVDSGYVVNLKGSGYDIVFARGEGTPLLYMPPNYSHRGAVRILKRFRYTPNPPSSVPTISSLEEHGTYQVICDLQKQKFLGQLVTVVSKAEQVYESDFTLMFGGTLSDDPIHKPLASSSDHASPISLQEPNRDPTTLDRMGDQQAMGHFPDGRYIQLRPVKDAGPARSFLHVPDSVETMAPQKHSSVLDEAITNSPQSSTFDLTAQSHETRPSTIPTSLPHKPQISVVSSSLQTTESQAKEEESTSSNHPNEEQNHWSPRKSERKHDKFDTETTYSFETLSDDPKLQYFQAFIDQLADDVRSDAKGTAIKDVGPDFLDQTLREFAWKLHEESTNPFQLETSVIIHRKRRHIVDLLDFQIPAFGIAESESDQSLTNSEVDDDDETLAEPFRKAEQTIIDWIGDISSGPTSTLSQMPKYRQFIQGSNAYRWLLTKIAQQSQLSCEGPSMMESIGSSIRNELKAHVSHRKMSRMRWMQSEGISSGFAKALPNILCLTGSLNEAQCTTVTEYMEQTWPQSGGAIITLLQKLLSSLEKKFAENLGVATDATCEHPFDLGVLKASITCDEEEDIWCDISATGGHYIVSEIGEQISWLASALRFVEGKHDNFISTTPYIKALNTSVIRSRRRKRIKGITGTCSLKFTRRIEAPDDADQGSCWKRLFSSPNIVRGYPIQRRSIPRTGLEIPLPYAASIVGSYEVVQWDERLLIKGFNMLLIATHVATDVMVWHLLITEKPEERISHIDPRLDEVSVKHSEEMSLRYVERKRHIIGWCTKATDFCGKSSANHEIKAAGLPRAPTSTVIDKLYIEGGSPVTAGLMLDINKKEQPFWLQREKDYPSLLNWVKLQPVVFYDVEDRRAWLIDGASAVLHLVRISLHRDTNDPESAYDWVYDPSKLKDDWPGVGSRQAALQTLKRWDNRALGVYFVSNLVDSNGVPIPKYSTFEERVSNILHSIERLVDRQAKTASQDGIRISQTLDPRRDIVGFDIIDIIDPSVPIYPRIQHLSAWGHGWNDLIPTVGITTIFGRNFGDLIRSDKPNDICPNWRTVPAGKDYLAASISTMQMLHEKRLLRMEPGLVGGELTKKITWVASKEASVQCSCLKKHRMRGARAARSECNHNPVQFLAKRWWSRTIPHGLKPVHLGSLDAEGAVIFGHTVLGLRTGDRSTSRQTDDDGAASTTSGEQGIELSATGSLVSQATSVTVPSIGHSSQDAGSVQQSLDSTSNTTGEGKKKRWSKFKDWVKR
ncbi:hypothetical protein FDENT_3245 [Fusarium denticulatum]|uniref:Heterokaryon incompatibility domain-containing protein n=1 Tax=Fusarium denticulatum TaxID=48507 RepID=A0A8H5XE59_9HYPO|nr:hypothetical protein FDENT_3245 [Fusarium denticulatum]